MVVIVLVIVAVLVWSFPVAGIKSTKENPSEVRSGGDTVITETFDINNSEYSIVNNAEAFQQYIYAAHHCQAYGYPDMCLGFSMGYADSIVTGDFEKAKHVVNNSPQGLSHYGYSGRKLFSSKEEMLKEAYLEIAAGRPVIIHINGNTNGTSRHYSPAVGFKKTTDPNNVQETDFLIIDVYDAKLEPMNGKGSKTRFITSGRDCGWAYDYELYKYY